MPILKWELKDPKSCKGCDLHNSGFETDNGRWEESWCSHLFEGEANLFDIKDFERPQACIDELGE